MRISRIQLLGFKSFAAKTEFKLDPGITAIVGPNGCGKSNVIDALKWVLGEQKPSSLRAREMMDVIFAGTGRRRPVGMAEVGIVFDNSDGRLPLDHTEVVLTRRLYRSGESQYLLNGDVCRLKDLREVLMDTGSGLDALSIMEQGRIDRILTANPVERRAVFEEAAGIGRFKSRRKETLRRLERVGDDLVRLRDVIEITEKQLRSLRYQASRARRYREHVEELRKKRVTWALYRYHLLLTERGQVTGQLSRVAEREEKANAELRALLDELAGEETSFEEAGRRVREAEGALLKLDSEIRSARESAEHGRRLAGELADRARRCDDEIRVAGRRREEMESEREKLADDLAALAAEVALRESELQKAEEEIEAAREVKSKREAALTTVREERFEVVQRRTAVKNELVALSSDLKSGEAVSTRLERRMSALTEERAGLARERDESAESAAALAEEEADVRQRLSLLAEEYDGLTGKKEGLDEQAAAIDRKLSGLDGRLELLLNLKARNEGMDQAVRKVLEEAARPEAALSGVHGVVADLIRVEGQDADAVELALGACAQGVVVERLDDALAAIRWLKEQGLGRVLFLPLDQVRDSGATYGGNGIARVALASVDSEPKYQPLIRALLSDSVLVEDLDAAKTLTERVGWSLRIVTGGGEVVNRIGTITGGRGKAAAALLSRNAEIESIEEEVAAERERGSALAEARETLDARMRELSSERKVIGEELSIAARKAAEAASRASLIETDLTRLADEEEVLGAELGELERDRETASRREAELMAADVELGRQVSVLDSREAAVEERVREAGLSVGSGKDRLTEVRIELARSRERHSAAEGRLGHLVRGIDAAGEDLERNRVEREECLKRREEALLEAEVSERRAEEGAVARERLLSEAAAFKREYDAVREKLLERRRGAEELREEHERYRGDLEEFRLKENEVRTRIEELLTRVRDEFELDLPDLYEGFDPSTVDWESLDREVADLKQKVDRMGNVNLEAIDQLEEVEEKAEFLRREEADLLKSRETLTEVLRKVNRESRERFEKSFAEIREHFREMFRKLFGGGNAELRLAEGEDILEAGVEIVVRPPGRELQNLNLLSGGEKTLTAVALLFAIFKARPSPFALMDEVDAALDESNIDRFLALLREFTHESQFVIITHNKRTMAEADALWGVSMPEAGVSQPMSIRFADESGGNGNGSAGNGGAKVRRKAKEAPTAAGS